MVIKMEIIMPDKRAFRVQGDTLDELKYQEWFWNFLGVEMPEELRAVAIQTGMINKEPPLVPQEQPQQLPPRAPHDTRQEYQQGMGQQPPQPPQQQPPQQPQQPPQQPQQPPQQQEDSNQSGYPYKNNPSDQYVG